MPAQNTAPGIEPAAHDPHLQGKRLWTRSQVAVPPAAKWLGGLGAIPFVFLSGISHVPESPFQGQISFALTAYGAVILSFLGGIHWGLAIAGSGADGRKNETSSRLVLSVVPSLIGWGALFLPRRTCLRTSFSS